MTRRLHVGPLVGVALVVVLCGATALIPAPSGGAHRSTLTGPATAESSAMVCPPRGAPLPGTLTVYNTQFLPRTSTVTVFPSRGAASSVSRRTGTRAFSVWRPSGPALGPTTVAAASVEQPGSGFVGNVSYGGQANALACTVSGTPTWLAAGLSTVGTATLAVALTNPISTPAVVTVATWSSLGYLAPTADQGLVVPAQSTRVVDLTNSVVQASEIALAVHTLRGVVTAVALNGTPGHILVVPGQATPTRSGWFTTVATGAADTATVHLANEGSRPANVTIDVRGLGASVSSFSLTVPAQSTAAEAVVPSSRMPVAGDAVLHVRSDQPVVVSLTGTRGGDRVGEVPTVPADRVVVATGSGATLRLVNPTRASVVVTLTRAIGGASVRTLSVPAGGVVTVRGSNLPAHDLVLVHAHGVLVTMATSRSLVDGLSGR